MTDFYLLADMYAVVVFTEENDRVQLVLAHWLENCSGKVPERYGSVYWPPIQTDKAYEHALQIKLPANKTTWSKHPVRVLGEFGTV